MGVLKTRAPEVWGGRSHGPLAQFVLLFFNIKSGVQVSAKLDVGQFAYNHIIDQYYYNTTTKVELNLNLSCIMTEQWCSKQLSQAELRKNINLNPAVRLQVRLQPHVVCLLFCSRIFTYKKITLLQASIFFQFVDFPPLLLTLITVIQCRNTFLAAQFSF